MADRTLEIKITGDASHLKKAFGTAGKDAEGFGKKVTGHAAGALKGLGIIAGGAALGGIALLGKGLMDGVKSLSDHQRAAAQTNAVIKSTGATANVSQKHVNDLANQIEGMGAADDIAITKGENMLLTFTNIRNETGKGAKVFDQATKTLADMTVAMGSDPQKQAIQLGKALNDPIKGISALSKVGVTFDDQQKKLIKTYMAHGQTAKAQAVILKELHKEFGGSAAAAGKTMAGQVNILKSHLDDLEQEIAKKVLPILNRLIQWAVANWPAFERVARQAMKVIGDVWNNELHPALDGLIGVVKGIMGLSDTWKTVILAVGAAIGAVVIAAEAWVAIQKIQAAWTATVTVAQALWNAVMTANPIGLVVVAIAALVGAMVVLYTRSETARDIINAAFGAIKTVGSAVFDFFTSTLFPAFKSGWDAAATVVGVAVDLVRGYINGVRQTFEGVVNLVGDLIHGRWDNLWGDAKQIVSGLLASVNAAMLGIPGKILGALGDIATAAGKLASGVVDKIVGVFSGLGDTLAGLVKGAVNAAIGFLNSGFNTIRGHWPDIPGAPGPPWGKNPIPTLAAGGIVTRPTFALIGEAGPEAVIPLSGGRGGSMGDTFIVNNYQNMDPRAVARAWAWQAKHVVA